MQTTDLRELAQHGGPKGFSKALSQASALPEAGTRCRYLAWVARFGPEAEVVPVAEKALTSAFSAEDPYAIVWAASWPLRALIERGRPRRILPWLPKLLAASDRITHPLCRMNALYLLWQAIYPANRPATKPVLEKLVAACLAADSWKAGATLRDILLVVASENADEAARFIDAMPEGVYKRQTQRRVAEGRTGYIYPFFW